MGSEINAPAFRQRGEGSGQRLQECHGLARLGVQLQAAGFQFGQIQQLVDQVQQAAGIALHQAVERLWRDLPRSGQQLIQGTQNQGERGSELVGDVGKEAGAHPVELLELLGFQPLEFGLIPLLLLAQGVLLRQQGIGALLEPVAAQQQQPQQAQQSQARHQSVQHPPLIDGFRDLQLFVLVEQSDLEPLVLQCLGVSDGGGSSGHFIVGKAILVMQAERLVAKGFGVVFPVRIDLGQGTATLLEHLLVANLPG